MKLKSILLFLVTIMFGCNVFAYNDVVTHEAAVIGTMIVLNKNEIAAANMALKRNVNFNVRNYAQLMQREHTANLQMWQNLSQQTHIKPIWSPTARAWKSDGQKLLTKLKPLNNKQFQIAYINAMINGHYKALQLIDQKLMKFTGNPTVTSDLKNTRKHVAYHLQRAKIVQKQLLQ